MSTLSVPLSPQHEEFINRMVKSGEAANKADVVRKALKLLAEEQAIQAVLMAQQELTLRGDLQELAKRIK